MDLPGFGGTAISATVQSACPRLAHPRRP